jgi:hypothetical protein
MSVTFLHVLGLTFNVNAAVVAQALALLAG